MYERPSIRSSRVWSAWAKRWPACCGAKWRKVVTPPAAAEREPLSKSSTVRAVPVSSSRCVCGSTTPGNTSRPVASMTSPSPAMPSRTSATFPSRTRTSAFRSPSAVTTVAPRISMGSALRSSQPIPDHPTDLIALVLLQEMPSVPDHRQVICRPEQSLEGATDRLQRQHSVGVRPQHEGGAPVAHEPLHDDASLRRPGRLWVQRYQLGETPCPRLRSLVWEGRLVRGQHVGRGRRLAAASDERPDWHVGARGDEGAKAQPFITHLLFAGEHPGVHHNQAVHRLRSFVHGDP